MMDYETYRVYGPGDDPAELDPSGRVCGESVDGKALLSAGLSEFPMWDDVVNSGPDRHKLAAISWALGADDSGPCVHTQTKRLEEALNHLNNLVFIWAPDDLDKMPEEWVNAAKFLKGQRG